MGSHISRSFLNGSEIIANIAQTIIIPTSNQRDIVHTTEKYIL